MIEDDVLDGITGLNEYWITHSCHTDEVMHGLVQVTSPGNYKWRKTRTTLKYEILNSIPRMLTCPESIIHTLHQVVTTIARREVPMKLPQGR